MCCGKLLEVLGGAAWAPGGGPCRIAGHGAGLCHLGEVCQTRSGSGPHNSRLPAWPLGCRSLPEMLGKRGSDTRHERMGEPRTKRRRHPRNATDWRSQIRDDSPHYIPLADLGLGDRYRCSALRIPSSTRRRVSRGHFSLRHEAGRGIVRTYMPDGEHALRVRSKAQRTTGTPGSCSPDGLCCDLRYVVTRGSE